MSHADCTHTHTHARNKRYLGPGRPGSAKWKCYTADQRGVKMMRRLRHPFEYVHTFDCLMTVIIITQCHRRRWRCAETCPRWSGGEGGKHGCESICIPCTSFVKALQRSTTFPIFAHQFCTPERIRTGIAALGAHGTHQSACQLNILAS